MYDGSECGVLSIIGLMDFQKGVPENGRLYNEIQKYSAAPEIAHRLINEYMSVNVYKRSGGTKKEITEEVFSKVVDKSVLAMVHDSAQC